MELQTVKGKILTEVTGSVQMPTLLADLRPWCLRVVTGSEAGKVFVLGNSAVIGREEAADIRMPAGTVSRRHCHLFRRRGSYWVTDLGATNPTLVNGKALPLAPLGDGDVLTVGEFELKMLGPQNRENPEPPTASDPQARDAVTGLLPRAQFRDAVQAAFAAACSQGSAMAMVVFDLDHFKHIVDRFSFRTGDRVLATVARLVREHCKGREIAGRIGGEEFALLLPGGSREDALRLAERLRLSVAAVELIEDGEPILFTISVGVATLRPGDPSAELLYGRADASLYEAKRQGRNRVVAFPDR